MSDCLFVPLRPFFCAAIAKCRKVQFRRGLHKFSNIDSKKRHILMRAAVLCNGINGTINKKNTINNTSRIKVHMKGRQRSKFKI